MMVQACLGLTIDGWRGEIHVDRPRLPAGIDRLTVRQLAVGEARVDLTFMRIGERVVAYPENHEAATVPITAHA
jgi:hypothetical protein